VAFLEGDNLVQFYYFSESEICPDKRSGLWWDGPYKTRFTVLKYIWTYKW